MRGPDKTILVTGGAGFIGSNFVIGALEDRRAGVVSLDALTYAGNLETLAPVLGRSGHAFVEGNIGDRVLVGRLLEEHRPEAIVNFAAQTHVDRSIDGPASFVRTNVLETFELLETTLAYWGGLGRDAQRRFRFLHVSTDEVYGSVEEGSFDEASPYKPNSPYAASKAASDHFVYAYHRTYGLPTITVNCSNNYGPRQYPEKLVPLAIHNALAGRPVPLYGDGSNVRDWLYVGDHCRAVEEVLKGGRAGETYNVGGGNERTNLEVVRTVCGLLDGMVPDSPFVPHASLATFVEDRPGHDRRYAVDAGKIRRELGWVPRETFESGMEKTVRWYLDNQEWCGRVLSGAYQGERLGLRTSEGSP